MKVGVACHLNTHDVGRLGSAASCLAEGSFTNKAKSVVEVCIRVCEGDVWLVRDDRGVASEDAATINIPMRTFRSNLFELKRVDWHQTTGRADLSFLVEWSITRLTGS